MVAPEAAESRCGRALLGQQPARRRRRPAPGLRRGGSAPGRVPRAGRVGLLPVRRLRGGGLAAQHRRASAPPARGRVRGGVRGGAACGGHGHAAAHAANNGGGDGAGAQRPRRRRAGGERINGGCVDQPERRGQAVERGAPTGGVPRPPGPPRAPPQPAASGAVPRPAGHGAGRAAVRGPYGLPLRRRARGRGGR
eukprot:1193820-Prorocentrum_minimum.AAC.3